jgi:hypothetical protein
MPKPIVIVARVYGRGRGVSIEARTAYRDASIDDAEMTLWVIFDRSTMSARCLLSPDRYRIAASRQLTKRAQSFHTTWVISGRSLKEAGT